MSDLHFEFLGSVLSHMKAANGDNPKGMGSSGVGIHSDALVDMFGDFAGATIVDIDNAITDLGVEGKQADALRTVAVQIYAEGMSAEAA